MRILRKILKGLAYVLMGLLVLVLGGLLYILFAYPKSAPPQDLRVAGTPEQVERGRHLFHAVSQCADCHAVHDDDAPGDPIVPGGLGKENVTWLEQGAPFFPPNITPAALGDWTDGEILRAFTSGIRKNGVALFPAMPYDMYRNLSRPDAEALVAYIRTLEPVPVEHPRRPLGLPFSVIARFIPKPAELPERAPQGGVELGRYLTSISGCAFCHTPGEPPRLEQDKVFHGGHEFRSEGWLIRSANITPDSATGIGGWTREQFVARFKGSAGRDNRVPAPGGQAPESPMPWSSYAQMTEEELGAIYDFLRTVEPARRAIVRAERAPARE